MEFMKKVLIVSSFVIQTAPALNYFDLVNLNASCFPYDSCDDTREKGSFPVERCECKPSCVKFNTCCIDSPNRDPIATSVFQRRRRGTCKEVIPDGVKTFVTTKCDGKWQGDAIVKSMCESPHKDFRDPLSILPVTNRKNEVTYQNYFCAVCNNDVQSIEFWRINVNGQPLDNQLDYRDDDTDVSKSLTYNEEYGKWGIQSADDSTSDFVEFNIDFQVPKHLADVVPPCIPHLVSDCDSSWTDEDVRRKCNSYMAIVYIKSKGKNARRVENPVDPTAYRNIHCAICNFESYSENTICYSYGGVTGFGIKPPMSFSLLFDVNLEDGDKVGEVNHCKAKQVYDPFFKKCRTLQCGLPGFVLKNGACAAL